MPATIEVWYRAVCLDCKWKAKNWRLTDLEAQRAGYVHKEGNAYHRVKVVKEETRTSERMLK